MVSDFQGDALKAAYKYRFTDFLGANQMEMKKNFFFSPLPIGNVLTNLMLFSKAQILKFT